MIAWLPERYATYRTKKKQRDRQLNSAVFVWWVCTRGEGGAFVGEKVDVNSKNSTSWSLFRYKKLDVLTSFLGKKLDVLTSFLGLKTRRPYIKSRRLLLTSRRLYIIDLEIVLRKQICFGRDWKIVLFVSAVSMKPEHTIGSAVASMSESEMSCRDQYHGPFRIIYSWVWMYWLVLTTQHGGRTKRSEKQLSSFSGILVDSSQNKMISLLWDLKQAYDLSHKVVHLVVRSPVVRRLQFQKIPE